MVCRFRNHPIHKFLTELMFFEVFYSYKSKKNFFLWKKNVHIYRGLLFGFEFIIENIIFPSISDIDCLKEKTNDIIFENPYKICFLKMRKEIQLIFAHLISPFVEISILNLYVEKIVSEEKFYSYRSKKIPKITLLDNNLFGSKKSFVLMFSKIFFIFSLNLNLCYVYNDDNSKFFSYNELISYSRKKLLFPYECEYQRKFLIIACFFVKFANNFEKACDSNNLLKIYTENICSFVIKKKQYEYYEILERIENKGASAFLINKNLRYQRDFILSFTDYFDDYEKKYFTLKTS